MLNQREETELDGLKQLFQVHFVLFTFRRLPACLSIDFERHCFG